jgi:hypothetical protein
VADSDCRGIARFWCHLPASESMHFPNALQSTKGCSRTQDAKIMP